MRVTLSLVRELASRYPVYYANGNHEERNEKERTVYGGLYRKFTGELKRRGLSICRTRAPILVRISGLPAVIWKKSITDTVSRFRFCRRMSWSAIAAGRISRGFKSRCRIRRCFNNCRHWGAGFDVVGHFHGGTIRLPLLGGVMTPQYQFFFPGVQAGLTKKEKQ